MGRVLRDNEDGTVDVTLATGEISYNAEEWDLQSLERDEYRPGEASLRSREPGT